MNFLDFAIAISVFIIFFVLVMILASNYFSNLASLNKRQEYKQVATNYFNQIFTKRGTPTNWEDDPSNSPVELGLADYTYQTPILVIETGNLPRSTEPVTTRIMFDEDCANKAWNNTLRIYDEDNNMTAYELSDITFCSSQYLKEANATWAVNLSTNEEVKYYAYYSGNDDISGPGYSNSFSTSSWIPNNGDSYTESVTDWSRYGGASGSPALDTGDKMKGTSSISITGTFNSSQLGVKYDPSTLISGVDNNWYLDAWVKIDSTSGINGAKFFVKDNNETINIDFIGNVSSNAWYHFLVQLNSGAGWSGWVTFNATKGIDYIIFETTNSSSNLTRTAKIDNLLFRKKPLDLTVFPEKKLEIISSTKLDALKNKTVDEVKKTIGEDYKVRIEVIKNK